MNPYPYESLAYQPGITPKPEPFSPKGDAMNVPSTSRATYMNPAVNEFSPMQPIDGSRRDTVMNETLADNYRALAWSPSEGGGGAPGAENQVFGGRPANEPADIIPRNYGGVSNPVTTGYSRAGGGGGGGGAGGGQPMTALTAPTMPEYAAPGYEPPEEDPNVYKKARREEMGAGMRELREGTREAISSAQSLDNPNARAKFIQQALKGYGQGLEKVASGASRQGRQEASRKRSEQLNLYQTEHTIKSSNYLANYQNEINRISTDFASQQAAQTANFNNNMPSDGSGGSVYPERVSSSMKKYGFEVIYG